MQAAGAIHQQHAAQGDGRDQQRADDAIFEDDPHPGDVTQKEEVVEIGHQPGGIDRADRADAEDPAKRIGAKKTDRLHRRDIADVERKGFVGAEDRRHERHREQRGEREGNERQHQQPQARARREEAVDRRHQRQAEHEGAHADEAEHHGKARPPGREPARLPARGEAAPGVEDADQAEVHRHADAIAAGVRRQKRGIARHIMFGIGRLRRQPPDREQQDEGDDRTDQEGGGDLAQRRPQPAQKPEQREDVEQRQQLQLRGQRDEEGLLEGEERDEGGDEHQPQDRHDHLPRPFRPAPGEQDQAQRQRQQRKRLGQGPGGFEQLHIMKALPEQRQQRDEQRDIGPADVGRLHPAAQAASRKGQGARRGGHVSGRRRLRRPDCSSGCG